MANLVHNLRGGPNELIYLASPYTSSTQDTEILRADQVSRAVYELHRRRYNVFSPITHGHAAYWAAAVESRRKGVVLSHLPADWYYKTGLTILRRCDLLWVFMLDGWAESKGVQLEIQEAQNHKIPIMYLNEMLFLQLTPTF